MQQEPETDSKYDRDMRHGQRSPSLEINLASRSYQEDIPSVARVSNMAPMLAMRNLIQRQDT